MTKKTSKQQPDYFNVKIDKSKDPTEYTWAERRAELLDKVEALGDPQLVNRTKAADRYGVSIGQISQDMDRIAQYLVENIDTSQYTFRLQTAFNKIYRKYMEEGKYMKAWNLIRDWGHFLFDIGVLEKEPDKLDLTGGFQINIERVGDEDVNREIETK